MNSLEERIGIQVESSQLLRPGPGFSELSGEKLFVQKLRLQNLIRSEYWDKFPFIEKSSDKRFTLQEYQLYLTLGDSNISWTMDALATFAAPLASRNLLVQLSSEFYHFSTEAEVPAVDNALDDTENAGPTLQTVSYQSHVSIITASSKFFGGTAKFISVDLYTPNTENTNSDPHLDENEAVEANDTDVTKENPMDAFGMGRRSDVVQSPLYYVKNFSGPQANGKDLTYGSIFVLAQDSQTAGSGFGIWLGPDIKQKDLTEEALNIIVLANPANQEEKRNIELLEKKILTTSDSDHLKKSSVKKSRAVPAFDANGLLIGGFNADSGLPYVSSLEDYTERSNKKPATGDQATLVPKTSKPKVTGRTGVWQFTQYTDGSRWKFLVYFERLPGNKDVKISKIRAYKDGYLDVEVDNPKTLSEGSVTVVGKQAYWWYLKFERVPMGEFSCGIDYHIYGTPLFGWDTHVRKGGYCK